MIEITRLHCSRLKYYCDDLLYVKVASLSIVLRQLTCLTQHTQKFITLSIFPSQRYGYEPIIGIRRIARCNRQACFICLIGGANTPRSHKLWYVFWTIGYIYPVVIKSLHLLLSLTNLWYCGMDYQKNVLPSAIYQGGSLVESCWHMTIEFLWSIDGHNTFGLLSNQLCPSSSEQQRSSVTHEDPLLSV